MRKVSKERRSRKLNKLYVGGAILALLAGLNYYNNNNNTKKTPPPMPAMLATIPARNPKITSNRIMFQTSSIKIRN